MASIFHKRNGSWQPANSEIAFSDNAVVVYLDSSTGEAVVVDATDGSEISRSNTNPSFNIGFKLDSSLNYYNRKGDNILASWKFGTGEERWTVTTTSGEFLVGIGVNDNDNVITWDTGDNLNVYDSSDGTEIYSNSPSITNNNYFRSLRVVNGFTYGSGVGSDKIQKVDITNGNITQTFTDSNGLFPFDADSSGNVVYDNGTDLVKLDSNLNEVWRTSSVGGTNIGYNDQGDIFTVDNGGRLKLSKDNGSSVNAGVQEFEDIGAPLALSIVKDQPVAMNSSFVLKRFDLSGTRTLNKQLSNVTDDEKKTFTGRQELII